MNEFFSDNWLALLSMIVALVGGLPGIVSLIKHYRDKPIFSYTISNIVMGQFVENANGQVETMVFISGTISNKGNQPLSPSLFELFVEIEGKWKQFRRMLVPETTQFHSETQEINVREPWRRDLQRFSGAIDRGMPVHGFLMFAREDVSLEAVRKAVEENRLLKLECTDIYGAKHQVEFRPNSRTGAGETMYPKHSMSIRNKA